jgi:hypothetical protein
MEDEVKLQGEIDPHYLSFRKYFQNNCIILVLGIA